MSEKTLEQMSDGQDMLDFFLEKHKETLKFVKRKMFYAFKKYIEKTREAYKDYTKSMTKEQKEYFDLECEEGYPEEWVGICDEITGKIGKECNVDIELDEFEIHIWSYELDFFWVHLTLYQSDYNDDLNFERKIEDKYEIELTRDAEFLIDLINKLILDREVK